MQYSLISSQLTIIGLDYLTIVVDCKWLILLLLSGL